LSTKFSKFFVQFASNFASNVQAGLLKILILGFPHKKLYGIALFIADRADYILCQIPETVIYADDTGVFAAVEDRGLWPAYKIGNPFAQKRFFDEPLAFRISDFTQFDFVIHFQ